MMAAMPSPAPLLTSTTNPRFRAATSLRERRQRDRTGLTLIDGARELRRAIGAGVEIVEAFVCESMLAGPDARAALDSLSAGTAIVRATNESLMRKLAFGERAEGIVAVARIPSVSIADLRAEGDALLIVVEGIEKPGNLGAVLRSADGAGADGVVAASPATDLYNPNTIRASAGTVFTVPLATAHPVEVLVWLRQHQIRVIATRVDAPLQYTAVDLTGPIALVFGAEADGLSQAWDAEDVLSVHVPMLGVADSLNVSVTAAILVYEARRQRSLASDPNRS